MTSENNLEIGKKIEISYEGKEQEEYFVSNVMEILDEDTYVLAMPIVKGNIYPLELGSTIDIYYYIEEIGLFYFSSKVESRQREPIAQMTVKRVSDIKKIQRRNYFRLKVSFPVTIKIKEDQEVIGYAKDLSAGGMKVSVSKKILKKENLEVRFEIDDVTLKIQGSVIRSELENSSQTYDTGIKFLNLSESDINTIMKYLFKKQRILIKKGLM